MAEPRITRSTAPEPPRAVVSRLDVLKLRSDFLRAARGRRVACRGFILQAAKRPVTGPAVANPPLPPDRIRVGFTCSKKVGNAVARNRAKRRLREIARLVLPCAGQPGYDYVLIGRAEHTAALDFETLQADLRRALHRLHGKEPA